MSTYIVHFFSSWLKLQNSYPWIRMRQKKVLSVLNVWWKNLHLCKRVHDHSTIRASGRNENVRLISTKLCSGQPCLGRAVPARPACPSLILVRWGKYWLCLTRPGASSQMQHCALISKITVLTIKTTARIISVCCNFCQFSSWALFVSGPSTAE